MSSESLWQAIERFENRYGVGVLQMTLREFLRVYRTETSERKNGSGSQLVLPFERGSRKRSAAGPISR